MKLADSDTDKRLYKRLLIRCALLVFGVLLFLFVLPKVVHMLFPFVITFFIAMAFNPFVSWVNRKLRISRRIVAIVLELLILFLATGLVGWLVYTVINEAVALATNIQLNWNGIIAEFDGLAARLNSLLPPQIMEVLTGFEDNLIGFVQSMSKTLLSSALSAATTMTMKTGSFFVNLVVGVLAAYFMISDYNHIGAMIKKRVGERAEKYISLLKNSAVTALFGYVKSQLLLALTAFIVMLVALMIYGQPYALLIALFLGFIDLLPVVGTIAVLVPWGMIELIGGNANKGIFLIILGVAFFLVRKVIEPKIVGSQTGLHPLAALMSTFVGLQFSGVWGAVLGPVVLMLAIGIFKSGVFDNTIVDIKTFAESISKALHRDAGTGQTIVVKRKGEMYE